MKSFTALLFTTFFLLQAIVPGMDLCGELMKIPSLLEHYAYHRDFRGDSFFEYLAEEYLNDTREHHDDPDNNQHSNLPFHGQHHCGHSITFIPTTAFQELAFNDNFSFQSSLSFYQFSYSESHPDSPFQPPKG